MVFFSTHPSCERAPADFLAGGDYDGDKGLVIANENIVHNFTATDKDSAAEVKLQETQGSGLLGAGRDVAAQAARELRP